MDLQSAALIMALASPLIMSGVAWGTLTAQMRHLRADMERTARIAERAHERVDKLQATHP